MSGGLRIERYELNRADMAVKDQRRDMRARAAFSVCIGDSPRTART
jgi:hypothetical protein